MIGQGAIVIYFDGCFIRRENGAHARVLDLIGFVRELSGRVILYSYMNHPTNPWGPQEIEAFHREFPNTRLVLDKRSPLLRLLTRLKTFLIAVWPRAADRLISTTIPGLSPGYERLLADEEEPLLLVNYALGLADLNGVKARRVVIETHDLQFLNAAKALNRRLSDLKTLLRARVELELLNLATALIAIAIPEAKLFRLFYPKMPVYFIPTYGRLAAEEPVLPAPHRYDLLFVGSENALNVDGLCAFIEENRAWLNGHRFAVAGRVCSVSRVKHVVQGLDGIDLLGFVEDLGPVLRTSKVVLSPVDGTGQKIKILDALAAGKAVFGSRHSLEALPPGFERCVFPLTTSGIDALLEDDEGRGKAERAARSYFASLAGGAELATFRSDLEGMLKSGPVTPRPS